MLIFVNLSYPHFHNFDVGKIFDLLKINNINTPCISNAMEKYEDEKLLDNYEDMARAYSKSLKNKGFVFIKLEDEEFSMLVDEINIIFAKILATFEKLSSFMDCKVAKDLTEKQISAFNDKFHHRTSVCFNFVQSATSAFLTLISLENTLTLKLMILSVKSGELEFCHEIITARAHVYANSFSLEGFVLQN